MVASVAALQTGVASLPPVTLEMAVVFLVVVATFVLFVTEALPADITAIMSMVTLVVLGPVTGVSVEEGFSGFANDATLTVLAMLIISNGVQRTGIVQILGSKMAVFAGTDERRQLLATVGVAGIPSAFLNNTPIVAMLIPVVSDLARDSRVSPSKLLIPLSYASMFGGMLTLIGTSTNILASEVSARLIDRPFSMFEFTHLGLLVFVTGTLYLLTVGRRLVPERISADEGYVEEYDLGAYLTEVVVDADSPMAGQTVRSALDETPLDVDVVQLFRDGESFSPPLTDAVVHPGDRLLVRADLDTLRMLMAMEGVSLVPETSSAVGTASPTAETQTIEAELPQQSLVEVVVPSWSALVGETLASSTFGERYDATVLAIRRGPDVVNERFDRMRLRSGDTMLLRASESAIDRLASNRDFILLREVEEKSYRTSKIPVAVAIVVAVVGLATFDVLDILVAAFGGIVAMVLADVVHPSELYDSVPWDVIFLLAGVIPLGIALEQTGGADFIGALVASTAAFLPPVGVLWVFYAVTVLVTALISNNASVVLMIPVAVEAARTLGVDPFPFVLAVTFAASADFSTPIGYQTNLMVYGPGGYRFTDYARVGAPLQLLLSVVTVGGIALFWGA